MQRKNPKDQVCRWDLRTDGRAMNPDSNREQLKQREGSNHRVQRLNMVAASRDCMTMGNRWDQVRRRDGAGPASYALTDGGGGAGDRQEDTQGEEGEKEGKDALVWAASCALPFWGGWKGFWQTNTDCGVSVVKLFRGSFLLTGRKMCQCNLISQGACAADF